MLRAFFKTEDDVQSVEAELHRLHVNNVIADEIPADDSNAFTGIPLFATTTSSTANTGSSNLAAAFLGDEGDAEDSSSFSRVLEFQVTEGDYQEALRIVANNGGRVEKQQK